MSGRLFTALLLASLAAQADELAQTPGPSRDKGTSPAPSLELLEFLADFGRIDAETLDLLEYHARRDLQRKTVPTETEVNNRD